MKLTFSRGIIIGLLIGQLFMVPHVVKWMLSPVIYVETVPTEVYKQLDERRYRINDIVTNRVPEPRPLDIIITNPINVRGYCRIVFGESEDGCSNVMGFYYFDETNQRHMVFSIDSTAVLQHEFKHIFEAHYHRYFIYE